MENNLDRIVGKAPQIVFVPENQWPDIRRDYLASHKAKLATGKQEAADPDPKAEPSDDENEKPVVKKAEELFGKEILDIKND